MNVQAEARQTLESAESRTRLQSTGDSGRSGGGECSVRGMLSG